MTRCGRSLRLMVLPAAPPRRATSAASASRSARYRPVSSTRWSSRSFEGESWSPAMARGKLSRLQRRSIRSRAMDACNSALCAISSHRRVQGSSGMRMKGARRARERRSVRKSGGCSALDHANRYPRIVMTRHLRSSEDYHLSTPSTMVVPRSLRFAMFLGALLALTATVCRAQDAGEEVGWSPRRHYSLRPVDAPPQRSIGAPLPHVPPSFAASHPPTWAASIPSWLLPRLR